MSILKRNIISYAELLDFKEKVATVTLIDFSDTCSIKLLREEGLNANNLRLATKETFNIITPSNPNTNIINYFSTSDATKVGIKDAIINIQPLEVLEIGSLKPSLLQNNLTITKTNNTYFGLASVKFNDVAVTEKFTYKLTEDDISDLDNKYTKTFNFNKNDFFGTTSCEIEIPLTDKATITATPSLLRNNVITPGALAEQLDGTGAQPADLAFKKIELRANSTNLTADKILTLATTRTEVTLNAIDENCICYQKITVPKSTITDISLSGKDLFNSSSVLEYDFLKELHENDKFSLNQINIHLPSAVILKEESSEFIETIVSSIYQTGSTAASTNPDLYYLGIETGVGKNAKTKYYFSTNAHGQNDYDCIYTDENSSLNNSNYDLLRGISIPLPRTFWPTVDLEDLMDNVFNWRYEKVELTDANGQKYSSYEFKTDSTSVFLRDYFTGLNNEKLLTNTDLLAGFSLTHVPLSEFSVDINKLYSLVNTNSISPGSTGTAVSFKVRPDTRGIIVEPYLQSAYDQFYFKENLEGSPETLIAFDNNKYLGEFIVTLPEVESFNTLWVLNEEISSGSLRVKCCGPAAMSSATPIINDQHYFINPLASNMFYPTGAQLLCELDFVYDYQSASTVTTSFEGAGPPDINASFYIAIDERFPGYWESPSSGSSNILASIGTFINYEYIGKNEYNQSEFQCKCTSSSHGGHVKIYTDGTWSYTPSCKCGGGVTIQNNFGDIIKTFSSNSPWVIIPTQLNLIKP
jgi:hypothetical protein